MLRFLSRLVLVLALVPLLSACSSVSSGASPTPIIIVVTATTAPVAQQPPPSATAASAAPSPTTARNTATRPAVPPTTAPAATKPPAATNTASPTSSDVWVPGTVDGNHIDRFANIGLRDTHPPSAATVLTLQMLARIKGQNRDGGGIQSVKFVISDNKDEDVYQHEEDNAPFCAFQEVSGSTCRTLQMKPGLMWRKSDNGDPPKQIKSGEYTLKVTVNGRQGEAWIGTYSFKIP